MADAALAPEILQRPLYVFSLPQEILHTITLKSQQNQTETAKKEEINEQVGEDEIPGPGNAADSKDEPVPAKATSCNLCSLTFSNLLEQRSHVRSDLHNYNLKQRLKNLKPVTESEFEKLIGDLDESISGSESSQDESEAEDGNDSTLTALLKRQAKISSAEADVTRRSGGQPIVWLGSSMLPSNVSLGVYRALFAPKDLEHVVDVIKQKQFKPTIQTSKKTTIASSITDKSPCYFLCMVGGGHFAGMVVSLAPKLVTTHKGANERQAIVLAHKTFHRYTTRRKQGGAQSANDAAKGAAHSAGAGIRRANEAMLNDEIRALLKEWKSMIDDCELVFIRATGSMNRRTLFGPYEGQVLRGNDPRNRGFPFTTRRATQSELMRAFQELTRVKVSYIDETAIETVPTKQVESAPKPKPKSKKPTPEEEATILHTSQLTALIKRNKHGAMADYIKSNHLDLKTFVFSGAQHHTPLHMAAALGEKQTVDVLLQKLSANPEIQNDVGKTPLQVAKDNVRLNFRVARFVLGESVWNWDAAHVGEALDPQRVAALEKKHREEAEAEAKAESARRAAAVIKLAREQSEMQDKRLGKGRVLNAPTGADRRELEGRDMTPEMRMKLERERRARAAEARMKG